jgi:hypothetical protein
MQKPALSFLALGAGVICAIFLTWLWRQQRTLDAVQTERARRIAALPPLSSPLPAAANPTPETEGSPLLAQLQRALSRRNIRSREALLGFKDDAALRRFRERAKQAGLTIVGDLGALHVLQVSYDDLKTLQDDLLHNAADYEAVGANYLINVPRVPAREDRADVEQVPFGNRTLKYLGVDESSRANWGRGTTIAILDTGVAPDITFGEGRVRALDIGLGLTPGNGNEDGHGTSVASLAAGLAGDAAGIAPAANILSIRVTDANGTSDIFTLARGIVAAVDAGAKIINISLGGYGTNATLGNAIGYAVEHGALIVAAAGNDQAAQLAWPAADLRVVSVGAIDAAEQQVSFSNSGEQLQLTAPGYGVQTAWLNGQRAYVDGTSASAPLVSGAIAAVISQNPSLSPQQAAALLERTASDGGAPGADPAFGNGILNLGWAMNVNNSAYVDTAISSHYYDATNQQLDVVVQNRSGQAVTGSVLTVSGAIEMAYNVPPLTPGQSWVARVPTDAVALKSAGQLTFTTQLSNAPGVTDRVPSNNRKSSVLTGPGK